MIPRLPNKPRRRRGFVCRCGGDTHVIDSRPGKNSVRRRRECLACGLRMTTIDVTEEDARVIRAARDMARKLAATLEEPKK